MKLISVIMPTRTASPASLRNAVHSILDAPGTKRDDVEILLRLDDDDPERFPVAEELTKGFGSYVIGPRGRGYLDMGKFVDELVKIADSHFCWLFDDDAWVKGNWYEPLSKVKYPIFGPVFNAQHYVLGGSTYDNNADGGPVGLIMPTALVKTFTHRNPVDQMWLDEVHKRGWKIRQLQGVEYHHDGRPRVPAT